jgi:hypothetical protein
MTDDKNSYFDNDFGYKEKCEKILSNCYSCNKTRCNQCNYLYCENKCLKKVDKCQMILKKLIIHNAIYMKEIIIA